jgi:hypothetical protein
LAVIYMGKAQSDLRDIAKTVVQFGHPDPMTYMATMKARLEHQNTINNPGVAGRRAGTREWILAPLPYVAVFKKVDADVKIYRVLPGSKIRVQRPTPATPRRLREP